MVAGALEPTRSAQKRAFARSPRLGHRSRHAPCDRSQSLVLVVTHADLDAQHTRPSQGHARRPHPNHWLLSTVRKNDEHQMDNVAQPPVTMAVFPARFLGSKSMSQSTGLFAMECTIANYVKNTRSWCRLRSRLWVEDEHKQEATNVNISFR